MLVSHQDGVAPKLAEPFHEVLWIGHTSTEQQQLGPGRSERHRQFIVEATVFVPDQLVFVHDQQRRAFPAHQPLFLRFQSCDDDGRIEVLR